MQLLKQQILSIMAIIASAETRKLNRNHRIGTGRKSVMNPRIHTSKYMPHQGKRECERRLRRMGAHSA